MKRGNKELLKIFASVVLAVLFNCSDTSATSPLLSNNPSNIFLSEDYGPVKPAQHIAACMNFGETTYGHITLGLRAGLCTLFDPFPAIGYGFGADMRIRLSKHWELEPYTDYFTTSILGKGYRHQIIFGGNMLYIWIERPFIPGRLTPFLLGGLSYDNNDIRSAAYYSGEFQNWSPWLNLGFGEHYYFNKRLDLTLELFYSLPLATHPISYLTPVPKGEILNVKDVGGFHPGGLFLILSLNYTFGNI